MAVFLAGQTITADMLNAIATPAAWTPWTPTWTSLTIGNATQSSTYWRSGNAILLHVRLVIGSTTVVGAAPTFSLPVPAESSNYGGGMVTTYRDVSAGADYDGFIRLAGTTQGWLLVKNVAGANDGRTHIAAAVPFTWANGDIVDGFLAYEAA